MEEEEQSKKLLEFQQEKEKEKKDRQAFLNQKTEWEIKEEEDQQHAIDVT